jgi:hypothetical protein
MGDYLNIPGRPDVAEIRERAKARAEEARSNAEERKSEIIERNEERRTQITADVCERRHQTLETVMPRLNQGATSVKASIDTVYTRVTNFYESGQLTVDNFEQLVSNIETSKANAETAIATNENLTFTFDCENPSVGQQLDDYRTSAHKVTLKAYRQSVVELVSSMRAAASTQNDSDDNDSENITNE